MILSGDAGHGGDGGMEQASGIGELTLERMRAGALLSDTARADSIALSGGC